MISMVTMVTWNDIYHIYQQAGTTSRYHLLLNVIDHITSCVTMVTMVTKLPAASCSQITNVQCVRQDNVLIMPKDCNLVITWFRNRLTFRCMYIIDVVHCTMRFSSSGK